jgi:integrase
MVADNEAAWRPNTRVDYRWQLSNHLLPFFAGHRLSQITIAEVDRYGAAKVRAGVLSPTSINKTITRLAQILEDAVEYGLIDRNPAKGKRRRLKAAKPAPVWLDRAEHIAALLDAAGGLDGQARPDRRHVRRRAMLAVLVFAGLRISELLELRWRDVDLSGGGSRMWPAARWRSKTHAGRREVDVLPVLGGILQEFPRRGPDDRVFTTSSGTSPGASNVRRRVLAPAVHRANERLIGADDVPLPVGITPPQAAAHVREHARGAWLRSRVRNGPAWAHKRRVYVRVYRHGMRRDPVSRNALRELVGAADWAATGCNVIPVEFSTPSRSSAVEQNPAGSRGSGDGHGWFRTSDLSRVKRALSH